MDNLPHHVAIIPDGNRRWARNRGLPDFEGHRRGFEITPQICRSARAIGVHTLTLWAFSTENWDRSPTEISYLMKLFEKLVDQNLQEAKRDSTRIYHLGRKDRIPKTLAERLAKAEEETKNNDRHVLNVALDYGGQDEILRAVAKVAVAIKEGKISAEDLFQVSGKYHDKYPYYLFKDFLDTKDQPYPYPYPDLIVRTSNEKRLSGLYCWQGAYAELYWEKDHFPDFTLEKLEAAINDYCQRHRRFGGN